MIINTSTINQCTPLLEKFWTKSMLVQKNFHKILHFGEIS